MQQAVYACNSLTTIPEESSDDELLASSETPRTSSASSSSFVSPSVWNLTLLLCLFILSLSLDFIIKSTSIQNTLRRNLFTTNSLPKSPLITLPTHASHTTTVSNPQQVSNQLQKMDETKNLSQPNMARNIKFVVSAIGLEILGAIAIKFLMPSAPITSILAGLITTRRVRFLAKLKQWLMFLPKIARFEKKFKKISMTLKTLQKGLKSLYSQQKQDED